MAYGVLLRGGIMLYTYDDFLTAAMNERSKRHSVVLQPFIQEVILYKIRLSVNLVIVSTIVKKTI